MTPLRTAHQIATDNLEGRFASLKKSGAMTKQPSASPSIGKNLIKHAAAQVTRQTGDYYHPLYEPTNLQLPTKVREINQWARYYYRTDPVVGTATDLNAEFPVTGLRNVCDDPKVKRFFDEMAFDVLKIEKLLSFISLEYNKLGNAFPFGVWDDDAGRWKSFVCLNPDYVEIENNIFAEEPVLKLDPDDSLKRIVQTRKPVDIYNKIDNKIKAYIARGEKVPLSNFKLEIQDASGSKDMFEVPQVTHIARKNSMYESYGLPVSFRAFKVLMYKDMIRRAQFSIAKRHWRPIKVVKVGDDLHPADEATLSNVSEALNQASQDPNSWFIWHNYVNFDYITSAGKIVPLSGEYEWVDKEIYAAMGINRAIIEGSGPTYANASVGLQVLINRYIRFQKVLSNWIVDNVYKPVARAQGFYKVNKDTGDNELIVPQVEWEMMRLKDDAQQKTLYTSLQAKGLISKQTLLVYLGLDPEKEQDLIAKENEDAIAAKKTLQSKSPAPTPEEKGGPTGLVPSPGEEAGPAKPGVPVAPGAVGGIPGGTPSGASGGATPSVPALPPNATQAVGE